MHAWIVVSKQRNISVAASAIDYLGDGWLLRKICRDFMTFESHTFLLTPSVYILILTDTMGKSGRFKMSDRWVTCADILLAITQDTD